MVKIAGFITFIGALFTLILCIYTFIDDFEYLSNGHWMLVAFSIISISAVYYTLKMRFWTDQPRIIEDLEKENRIIQKRIEKMELLKKLESYENK